MGRRKDRSELGKSRGPGRKARKQEEPSVPRHLKSSEPGYNHSLRKLKRGGCKGTGCRSRAEFWPRGVSLKQNGVWQQDYLDTRPMVWIFSDSQLRPIVQQQVPPPEGLLHFGVNCTPGGTCWHVERELLDFHTEHDPDMVVLAVGTNNLHNKKHEGHLERAVEGDCEMFRSLVCSAAQKFPSAELVATSILPRLDSYGKYVDIYNSGFEAVCETEHVTWLDFTEYFPEKNLRLWAHDGLHLSECSGIPLYLKLLNNELHRVLFECKLNEAQLPMDSKINALTVFLHHVEKDFMFHSFL